VYLCVGLTTLATLLLELSLTRIFSVVFYYHLAFLAISIALFGLGIGGVFSYIAGAWKAPLYQRLGRLSAANSFLVMLALVVILIQKDNLTNWNLALIYFTTALPFFISGTIVSLAISETIERVNRVYFFDLLGAATGCLLLIPLLEWFGGPSTVVSAAIFFAVAAAIWFSIAGSVHGRVFSVGLALALVGVVMYNQNHHIIEPTHAKNQTLKNEFFIKWNSFSRIAVVHLPEEHRDSIVIDGDAATAIFNYDIDHLTDDQRHQVLEQGPALPYVVRPGAKVLIIGPGGGWDVARALASGSHDITAVEINPIIAETVMQQKFPQLSHGLYLRPDVHVHVEDGRAFVRRSTDRYQVIQATLVDTWASTAAGAFALSENNLYTVDAFRDYLSHLTDDGVVAVTRWGFDPPRESLRLISLAIEALRQLGETDPAAHVIVGRSGSVGGWGAQDTVLISRKPLAAADIARAQALFAAAKMEAVYVPTGPGGNQFYDLLRSPNAADYERTYTFDISPVTDNRPFFFYTVQPRDLWNFIGHAAKDSADYKINKAVPLLFACMGVSLLATFLIVVAPPLVLGTRLPRQAGIRGFLLYFLFIGAGYILIEVALIQKFVLFLGHPVHALWVVIFSMLVSSGLGSNFSRRVLGKDESRLVKLLGCIALGVALVAIAVSMLLAPLVWLPFGAKVVMTVALIAPIGFLMGMPFPTALARLEEWHAPSVRWAWSLNAASSVLGSVGALVCAIYLGLVQTMIVGGVFYLAALAVIARGRAGEPTAPQPAPGRVVLAK
jgi:spermidine synthase